MPRKPIIHDGLPDFQAAVEPSAADRLGRPGITSAESESQTEADARVAETLRIKQAEQTLANYFENPPAEVIAAHELLEAEADKEKKKLGKALRQDINAATSLTLGELAVTFRLAQWMLIRKDPPKSNLINPVDSLKRPES